jgi:hypothetical protein
MKPGRDPFAELARVASSFAGTLSAGEDIRTKGLNDATVLSQWCNIALKEGHDKRAVIFVDQFEEIFTQVTNEEQRVAFLNSLTHAATVEDGRAIILFSMRSDFVPNCATYPQLNSLLNQRFVQIGAMQPEELVSAIAQPALRVSLQIDPDLIAQIIDDMKGEPGALPLMQFALKDLFDAQQAKGNMIALTRADYIERGGIQKSLERHADTAFAELNQHEQELARNIFSRLIEIGRGTVDTRRTALSKELISADTPADVVKMVVQKLANARLVTTDAVTVTISHEKLIDAWPWLKKLVNENRDVIALQNEITSDAMEWDEHQRDSSYLYTGVRLVNAREKLEVKKLHLDELAQNFLETGIQMAESKRQEEERRRQKELDDARKLAETAQAMARAQWQGRLLTLVAIATTLVLLVLIYDPIRSIVLQWQARTTALRTIETVVSKESYYLLGDEQRTDGDPLAYLSFQEYPISAFSIDVDPVTNERYGNCVQAGACRRPNALQSEYAGEENAKKLVVNVTALDAAEYCNWLDMRLPSEKEWELAVHENILNLIDPNTLNDAIDFYEWTSSSYYDPELPEWIDISVDPPDALTLRGGQLNVNEPFKAYMTKRASAIPSHSAYIIGFRCAIDN